MISDDIYFGGFDAESWSTLLGLLGLGRREARGAIVIVERDDGTAAAALHTLTGAIACEDYSGRQALDALCARHDAERALVIKLGAPETLTERLTHELPRDADYFTQWLAMLGVLRAGQREGLWTIHPARRPLPLPRPATVSAALDRVLPDGHAWLVCIWEGDQLCTAAALRRMHGCIDMLVGPDAILDWTGPLGGDFRRDHRALAGAVRRALAPLHMGVFAQRSTLEALLANPAPGAWAAAIAVRDVIIDPAPPYVAVAAGADVARAAVQRARDLFGDLELLSLVEPTASFLRRQIGSLGSVTETLGFNPLQVLAERLSRRD
jgi:hypothetical protein